MKERIKEIAEAVPRCKTFADIGCDHGYVTQCVLSFDKCETAYISDISEKCLAKAEALLEKHIKQGRVRSIVSDGFENLPKCDVAVIAGMGGEEIVGIISAANREKLPETLILQPMKNADRVRLRCVKCGYKIEKDYLFYDKNKYYFLITATKGEDCLSEEEIEFGRTNVVEKSDDFIRYVKEESDKLSVFAEAQGIKEQEKKIIYEKIKRLKKYVDS